MEDKIDLALPASALASDVVPTVEQFALWRDYNLSEPVTELVLVKVAAHMIDRYLESLRDGFVPANEAGKTLGYFKEYKVYVSDLPSSGEFNVVLLTVYRSIADFAPSKDRDEALTKAWGEAARESTRITMTGMDIIREFKGQYLMRQVEFKAN